MSYPEKWEFGSKQWCEYCAELGVNMIRQARLDLDRFSWGFSEHYTFAPERLVAGRKKVGYYFMVAAGEVTGGAEIPAEVLELEGFHVCIPWASIAHASSFFYGREGQKQRSADEAVMWRELAKLRKRPEGEGMLKPAYWPPEIGAALSVDAELGGGLHNETAKRLKHSPEVKDLPQTEWGVPVISRMTDSQRQGFLKLLGE